MDIWRWVNDRTKTLREQGQDRLAHCVERLPYHVVYNEYGKVDALYPEALSIARSLGDQWLELFLRHWYLQAEILGRHRGYRLGEAVDLLDFAHRDATRDCPQSACVVQDLAVCYGIIDGPGYAEERLAVSAETLRRIDVTWPCFKCISGEYNGALIDAGRPEEALAAIAEQRRTMLEHGEDPADDPFMDDEVEVLCALRRYDEAEPIARRMRNDAGGDNFLRKRRGWLALCLAHLGRAEEARKEMLTYDEVLLSAAFFSNWMETQVALANQDSAANTEDLDLKCARLVDELLASNSLRTACDLLRMRVSLAVARGALTVADLCLERLESVRPRLHRDCGARAQLAELRQNVERAAAERAPQTFATVDDYLALEPPSRERALDNARDAYRRWRRDDRVISEYVRLLRASAFSDEALALARAESSVECPEVLNTFGHLLVDLGRADEFQQRFGSLPDPKEHAELHARVCWMHVRFHYDSNPQEAYRYAELLLAHKPDANNTRRTAARLASRLGDHRTAVAHWTRLIEVQPDEVDHHWSRLVPATIVADWQTVRSSALAVKLSLTSDKGPVTIDGGTVRLQFGDDKGGTQNFFAVRTGPVTARVTGIAKLGEAQHLGAEVVFDPSPLNRLDQKDEKGYVCDKEGYYSYLFPVVHVFSEPKYFYCALEGVHPGGELLKSFEDRLGALGVRLDVRSSDQYRIKQGNDKEWPGIYAYLAVPEATALIDVHAALDAFSRSLEHPWIWPVLLEALGDEEGLQAQRKIEEAYGL